MNKKHIIPILVILLCILALFLDYSDYTLMEDGLQQDMFEKTSEIIGPEGKDYQLQYSYAKGRIHFYSGQIYRDTQKIPLIYAYKKHWLLPRYKREDYVLRYSDTKITEHGPVLKTVVFEYKATHKDESLSLEVTRSLNHKTILLIAAYIVATLLGKFFRE